MYIYVNISSAHPCVANGAKTLLATAKARSQSGIANIVTRPHKSRRRAHQAVSQASPPDHQRSVENGERGRRVPIVERLPGWPPSSMDGTPELSSSTTSQLTDRRACVEALNCRKGRWKSTAGAFVEDMGVFAREVASRVASMVGREE